MKILHLIASPRGGASYSIKLGNAILDRLVDAHPGSEVTVRNLAEHSLPQLEAKHIASFFTPADQHTPELAQAAKDSEEAVAQLKATDIIVISTPVYNFTIHTALKIWIDYIVRAGLTFNFTENGTQGYVTGKKLYIALSSGGVFSEGPLKPFDFAEPYLRFVFSFIGITDVKVFRAEGLTMTGIGETALEKGINSIAL